MSDNVVLSKEAYALLMQRLESVEQQQVRIKEEQGGDNGSPNFNAPPPEWHQYCQMRGNRYVWRRNDVAMLYYDRKDAKQMGELVSILEAAGIALPSYTAMGAISLPEFSGSKDDWIAYSNTVINQFKGMDASIFLNESPFMIVNRVAALYDNHQLLPTSAGGVPTGEEDKAEYQDKRAAALMGAIYYLQREVMPKLYGALTDSLKKETTVRTVYQLQNNARDVPDALVDVDAETRNAAIPGYAQDDINWLWKKLNANYATVTVDRIRELKRELGNIEFGQPINTINANKFTSAIEEVAGKLKAVMDPDKYSVFEEAVISDQYRTCLPSKLDRNLRAREATRRELGLQPFNLTELKLWIVQESASIDTLAIKEEKEINALSINAMSSDQRGNNSAQPHGNQNERKEGEKSNKSYYCSVCDQRSRQTTGAPPASYSHNSPGDKYRPHIFCLACGGNTGSPKFNKCRPCGKKESKDDKDKEKKKREKREKRDKRVNSTREDSDSDDSTSSVDNKKSSTSYSSPSSPSQRNETAPSSPSLPDSPRSQPAPGGVTTHEISVTLAEFKWSSDDPDNLTVKSINAVGGGYDSSGNAKNQHIRAQLDGGAAASLTGNLSLLHDVTDVPEGTIRFKAVDHDKTAKYMVPKKKGWMWIAKAMSIRWVYHVPGINLTIISQSVLEAGSQTPNKKSEFIIDGLDRDVKKVCHRREHDNRDMRRGPVIFEIEKDKGSNLYFFTLPHIDEDDESLPRLSDKSLFDHWWGERSVQEARIDRRRREEEQKERNKIPKMTAPRSFKDALMDARNKRQQATASSPAPTNPSSSSSAAAPSQSSSSLTSQSQLINAASTE